jgi:hypothetical protein
MCPLRSPRMGLFRRKSGGAVVVDAPLPPSLEGLLDEIDRLKASNRSRRDRDIERRLLRLRHAAGLHRIEAVGTAEFAAPQEDALPERDGLPEVAAEDVTPGLIRAGILRDGALLVRGLVQRDAALGFAGRIDQLFADRAAAEARAETARGLYEEYEPETRFKVSSVRPWIRDGGGVLATDSPPLSYEMLELFESAGVPALVDGYLGEPAVQSVHKTTLRKAEPSVSGAWHQDGAFMGEVHALNLWVSLSRCGDEAPGLDLVPRRMERVVIDHEAMMDPERTRPMAEEAAGDVPIVRPIFEPGDALFFDELFLHQTASDPAMPNPRYAIESWFFGASAFPRDYAPIAV